MTPGLYEQVRDLTLDRKKFAPGTKVGLNDQYQLVAVIASYKDRIVSHPDPARLRNLLGFLIQSAQDVNQHLRLSDRAASTLEAKVAGELDFSILTEQVAGFLKTPACQIIRTREQLSKTLQASVRAKKTEQHLRNKLKKTMQEGFARFCDLMDSKDLNQLVGCYRAALLKWQDEFSHQYAGEGDLNDVYQATRNCVEGFITMDLGLYLKYPDVIGRCKSALVHQLIFLIQLNPEMAEHYIAVAAQHYLRRKDGLMTYQSPSSYKAARNTLLLSDFTLEESITLEFIKQYPQAALDIDPALFEKALSHPDLLDFWPGFIAEHATRLSDENWQQLFSGTAPVFHQLITRQMSVSPPLVCRFPRAFAPQVKSFLKANPDMLGEALKLPRQVESAGYRTLIAIARSLS